MFLQIRLVFPSSASCDICTWAVVRLTWQFFFSDTWDMDLPSLETTNLQNLRYPSLIVEQTGDSFLTHDPRPRLTFPADTGKSEVFVTSSSWSDWHRQEFGHLLHIMFTSPWPHSSPFRGMFHQRMFPASSSKTKGSKHLTLAAHGLWSVPI